MKIAKAYNGKEKFVFISYAHADQPEQTLSVISRLNEDGFRVWYDEGITPRSEWDEVIAAKVKSASLFMALISRNYVKSSNCLDELRFARDLNQNLLVVYVEPVQLSDGLRMRLSGRQAILKHNYRDPEDFYEKLLETPGLEDCRSSQESRRNKPENQSSKTEKAGESSPFQNNGHSSAGGKTAAAETQEKIKQTEAKAEKENRTGTSEESGKKTKEPEYLPVRYPITIPSAESVSRNMPRIRLIIAADTCDPKVRDVLREIRELYPDLGTVFCEMIDRDGFTSFYDKEEKKADLLNKVYADLLVPDDQVCRRELYGKDSLQYDGAPYSKLLASLYRFGTNMIENDLGIVLYLGNGKECRQENDNLSSWAAILNSREWYHNMIRIGFDCSFPDAVRLEELTETKGSVIYDPALDAQTVLVAAGLAVFAAAKHRNSISSIIQSEEVTKQIRRYIRQIR